MEKIQQLMCACVRIRYVLCVLTRGTCVYMYMCVRPHVPVYAWFFMLGAQGRA